MYIIIHLYKHIIINFKLESYLYIYCITPSRSFLTNLQDLDASEVSKVIRLVILGEALPVYAVVGAGGLWLHGSKVSANVLQE